MARVIPDGWAPLAATGAAVRERETLERLGTKLPDDYVVYHGVHWTRLEHGTTVFGEIDFVVVSPSGRVLLIEQKCGLLVETATGLAKRYGDKDKLVGAQLARNADGLQSRWQRGKGPKLRIETLLYCPDFRVGPAPVADIDPARIVDQKRDPQLEAIVLAALPPEERAPADLPVDAVHRFLRGELQLVPHVGTIATRAESLYTRLSGGLAEWGRRVHCEPFRLRVVGTAGSGKTQLALAVARDGDAAGRRVLYSCFNRPLADHMGQLVPARVTASTFHQIAERAVRAAGETVDWSRAGEFVRIEKLFAQVPVPDDLRVDDLVVDEGQDFQPAWRDALLRLLAPGGRAWWLEDPMQNLYGRAAADFSGWVTLRADVNYRSPPEVLDHLNRILRLDTPLRAASPVVGTDVDWVFYEDTQGLFDETKGAITRALLAGFDHSRIALLTFHGRERSAFTPLTDLGPHRLRGFTGRYDLIGSAIYEAGDLLCESVNRFKGQSAPCVVFTEIDFEQLDERTLAKLFVGATRATLRLTMVVSNRAAGALVDRLDAT